MLKQHGGNRWAAGFAEAKENESLMTQCREWAKLLPPADVDKLGREIYGDLVFPKMAERSMEFFNPVPGDVHDHIARGWQLVRAIVRILQEEQRGDDMTDKKLDDWNKNGGKPLLDRSGPEFARLCTFIIERPGDSRGPIRAEFKRQTGLEINQYDIAGARWAIVKNGGPPTGVGIERANLIRAAEKLRQPGPQDRPQEAPAPRPASPHEAGHRITPATAPLDVPPNDRPAARQPAAEHPIEFARRVMEAALRNATTGQLLAELQHRYNQQGERA